MEFLKNVSLALIPVFVAVDALGVLPIFTSLTEGVEQQEKSKIILQSMLTASGLAVGFIFLGKVIFVLLSITVNDFMIAGGVLLFLLAVTDIMNPVKKRRIPPKDLGVVPLGTPLIAGPAVLTTSMIIISQYGLLPTLISVVVNIFFAGLAFRFSTVLIKVIGESGTKAISKITSLLLAAIGVMMIRKGIASILLEAQKHI
jgi:multiple antibiotic resistance protein